MDQELKDNLSTRKTWLRLAYMVLFTLIYSVAEVVLGLVVFVQFLFVLVSSNPNQRLLDFGRQLSTFAYEIFLYLTFNSDEKPFPFGPWPTRDGDFNAPDAPVEVSATDVVKTAEKKDDEAA